MKTRFSRLLAIGAVFAAGPAAAADYMPIYGGLAAPELKPVEVGNGWYLRGDVSYDFESDLDGKLIGVAPTLADEPFEDGRLEDGFSGGLGIGYRLNDFLRTDVTARYGKSDLGFRTSLGPYELADFAECEGFQCSAVEAGEATTWDLMANAYVDLGTFAGVTPYIGAGAGAVRVDYEGAAFNCEPFGTGLCNAPSIEGDDSWRFAYAFSAGLGYNVNRSLTLDIGYRYLNVDGGTAYTVSSFTPVGDPRAFAIEDDGFDRHTIQAGLRYNLW